MQTRKGKPHQVESSAARETGGTRRKGRGRRQALPGKRRRRGLERSGKGRLTHHYSIVIQWSDEDQAYIVSLPEFLGCKTHGGTYEEAAKHGREVIELLVESYIEEGKPLPKPQKFSYCESSTAEN